MLRVKICGLRTLEDALAAIQAGADLLGFNFYPPSPRYLAPATCARLLTGLRDVLSTRDVKTVGVFVNLPPEQVRAILDETALDLAQMSGDEPPGDLESIGLERAFKVVRSDGRKRLAQVAEVYPPRQSPPACLVDASVPGRYGGTGKTADWAQARELALRAPVLLAGGLHPGNVGAAVRQVRPWGVDVASGIESAPGKIDNHRLRAFISAARSATQEVY